MYEFKKPPESFDVRNNNIVIDGRISAADKIPLPIFNPLNADHSAGAQAGRCAGCGSAGCFQGTGSHAIGCPFGRDIPDIHEALARAENVVDQAYKYLKRAAPVSADILEKKFSALAKEQELDLAEEYARFPLHIFSALAEVDQSISDKLKRLFDHHMKQAFSLSYKKGPMGDIYGRLCPSTLCQLPCTTNLSGHGAITIKMNEAALWDYAWIMDWLKPIKPKVERPETVLIVGSGFAGFAAAERAREHGYHVVVVEENSEPGEPGNRQILTYKSELPRFRRHYDRLRQSDVETVCNTLVGEDGTSLRTLKDRFNAHAIILATGAPKAKDLKLSGDASDKVINWNEFTEGQQRIDRKNLSGDAIPPAVNAKGKKVVIIGTGDTAIDCVRVAIAQGAKEIVIVSRHDKVKAEEEDRDAYKLARMRAEQAGIPFSVQYWMHPKEAKSSAEGGYTLSGSNRAPDHVSKTIELQADIIVNATGNETGSLRQIYEISNLPVKNSGRVYVVPVPERIADKTPIMDIGAGFVGRIDEALVFASGQNVRGAGKNSLAAVNGRDGIDAENWMHEALQDLDIFAEEIDQITNHSILALDAA